MLPPFFLLPMAGGRVLVVKGKQRYGNKRASPGMCVCVCVCVCVCHEMLLEKIKLTLNNGANIHIFYCAGCP